MKTIRQLMLMVALMLSVISASAYDFEVDGICYNVVSFTDFTCEVAQSRPKYFGEVTIPSNVNYNNRELSVIGVSRFAFQACDELISVEIPNSVTEIGNKAFDQCFALTSIVIPKSLTSIGYEAFSSCWSLTSIEIPDHITKIEKGVFSGCSSLSTVVIPNLVTEIGSEAFRGCSSLTSIEIPNSVTKIGSMAFSGCRSLTSIEIPNSVTEIESNAFGGCGSLKSFTFNDKLEVIKYGTFSSCSSLDSLTIPTNIQRIEQYQYYRYAKEYLTFKECFSLKELTFEYGTTLLTGYWDYNTRSFEKESWLDWINTIEYLSIDRELDYSMSPTALKELTLGEHIEKVQVNVKKSNELAKLTCYATTPPSGLSATNQQYMEVEVKVPKGTLEAYQSAEGWKNFWNISEMEDSGSGIESVVSDKAKTEIGRYNLQGRKVTANYPGMVIVKYSDGSTRKLINN